MRKYAVAIRTRSNIELWARHAKLTNPRVWQDDSNRYFVSGTDSKGRRVTLSTRTVRDLIGVLRDMLMRGGF